MNDVAIFWFRRDLRLNDNAGLYHALMSNYSVVPVFIFDTSILDKLQKPLDARVEFIHQTISNLKKQIQSAGSDIDVYHTTPLDAFKQICKKYSVKAIYTNNDYEPSAILRDAQIAEYAYKNGIAFNSFKDQVIFEKNEILNETNKPYRVYTPYKNKWLARLTEQPIKSFPSEKFIHNFLKTTPDVIPTLNALGFVPTGIKIPPLEIIRKTIVEYDKTRDYPYLEQGTSLLGIHFRFGTISIREKVVKSIPLNSVWLSELIWREFFMQLLYHFPNVVTESFQTKFNVIQWRTSEEDFNKWCTGKTGYPLVDAGMRELNATGYMHNRVRMVVASFLTKHLFIDWRWGEAYFAEKLLDYDLAANNGNWQWAAGTGADAQPYFRIFNPTAQQQKFDPDFIYIKKWVPEFGTSSYIQPIIDHKKAVERAKTLFSILKTT
jgi:deoxyribodipyrimidine photo-lyase